jgi:hypothetical protein
MTGITPRPIYIDEHGIPWWNWVYSYYWEGKFYSFEICARSKEEADDRLKRLQLAVFDGQADGGPIDVTVTPVTSIWPLLVW